MIRGLLLAQGVPTPVANIVDEVILEPTIGAAEKKVKRKVKSAYRKAYDKAFAKLSKKYKTKTGKWVKNGFKRAVKAAHAEARRLTK